MTPVNVLITAASRRVPLVQAFKAALRSLGVPGTVVVTDVNPLSPAIHFGGRAYRVPLATDPSYIDELLAICRAERVRLAVPTIDDELAVFGASRQAFADIGAVAACSPGDTAAICNDKYATCHHLTAKDVPAAQSWLPSELPADVKLPLFIKPRGGRGGVAAFPVRTRKELAFFTDYVDTPVVQEFLDGPEYTIDVLCDLNGKPLSIVPRERVVIRAGVIDRGRTVKSAALIELAERTCTALTFAGPINIQCRMRRDQPVIFEINPRFSGGIPLTIAAGADFPRLLVKLAMGSAVEPAIGRFKDNLWMTNYEASVFLDASQLRISTLSERGVRIGEVA